ncbi:MAG: FMN-binding negative transcriptional regulator [Rhodobacteraceae bacterium]|nr:FMN-binding negative transcriptional regulator [Paracoccaceae bacterium]
MYLPQHFVETDMSEISSLVADFPLAALVVNTAEGLVANHLPLMEDGNSALIGHIALDNDLHRQVSDGHEVLAIFRGEDAYVSPNWYATKPLHHRHVPTWNYQVVHVHGKISFQRDHKARLAAVGRLTKLHEAKIGEADPWKMSDAPKEYLLEMLDRIVAFRIDVTRVVAKSKLSQNREDADFRSTATVLESRGKAGLAARMRRMKR